MFTGIIKAKSKAKIISKTKTDLTIEVDLSVLKTDIKLGDSIAMDGVCLTVVAQKGNICTFDLMKETLDRTTYKDIVEEQELNIEDSLTLASKMDGHLVYGDVDCEGTIKSIDKVGNSFIYMFEYPKEFAKYLIDKGRITIDGASLTVINSSKDGEFGVALIPHSLKVLTISNKNVGDKINLEFDVYAKLVYKQQRGNND